MGCLGRLEGILEEDLGLFRKGSCKRIRGLFYNGFIKMINMEV